MTIPTFVRTLIVAATLTLVCAAMAHHGNPQAPVPDWRGAPQPEPAPTPADSAR